MTLGAIILTLVGVLFSVAAGWFAWSFVRRAERESDTSVQAPDAGEEDQREGDAGDETP